MNPPHDEDRQLHANLLSIGRSLERPPEPSPAQRQAWKSLRHTGPLSMSLDSHEPPSKGRSLMKQPRFLAALGTAAAAAIALSVVLTPGGESGRVMAATIMRSLRETMHRGLSIEIEKLDAEGVRVDGRFQLLFSQPVTLAQLVRDEIDPQPSALYAGLTVRADGSDPETAGLDVDLALALTDADKWAFLQLRGLPDQAVQEAPFLPFLASMFRNGMLFDLKGLEEFAGDSNLLEHVADALDDHDGGLRLNTGGLEIRDDHDPDDRVEKLVLDLLSGTAGAERVSEFVTQIEQIAGNVAVQRGPDGSWLLTASQFKLAADDEAEFLARAVLTIRYVQGDGINRAELAHVGTQDGLIRFGFIDEIDPSLLSRQPYVDRGVPMMDVAGVLKSLGVANP